MGVKIPRAELISWEWDAFNYLTTLLMIIIWLLHSHL